MTNIRRHFGVGQVCFLTHITYNRLPILVEHFDLLWRALSQTAVGRIQDVRLGGRTDSTSLPALRAWAILLEHLHMVIEYEDIDVSSFVKKFKLSFSERYRRRVGMKGGRVWQYRFWDRVMRDQDEFNNHLDYTHYNPVRHGLIDNPFRWRYSSAAAYLEQGLYEPDWGVREAPEFESEYGE